MASGLWSAAAPAEWARLRGGAAGVLARCGKPGLATEEAWVFGELPAAVRGRAPPHATRAELIRLVDWCARARGQRGGRGAARRGGQEGRGRGRVGLPARGAQSACGRAPRAPQEAAPARQVPPRARGDGRGAAAPGGRRRDGRGREGAGRRWRRRRGARGRGARGGQRAAARRGAGDGERAAGRDGRARGGARRRAALSAAARAACLGVAGTPSLPPTARKRLETGRAPSWATRRWAPCSGASLSTRRASFWSCARRWWRGRRSSRRRRVRALGRAVLGAGARSVRARRAAAAELPRPSAGRARRGNAAAARAARRR